MVLFKVDFFVQSRHQCKSLFFIVTTIAHQTRPFYRPGLNGLSGHVGKGSAIIGLGAMKV